MSEPTIEMLDEIVLGSARGGKRKSQVQGRIVRSLGEGDLEALVAAPPVGSQHNRLIQVKAAHHNLAQLMAKGVDDVEISLITGYSGSYLSNLKNDPAFKELLAYYGEQKEIVFADAVKRLAALGIATIEELQLRLESEPEKWTKQELMQLGELIYGKAVARPLEAPHAGGGSGLSISVKFVSAEAREGPILDITPGVASEPKP